MEGKEFWEDWDINEITDELESELRTHENGRLHKLLFMGIMYNANEVQQLNKYVTRGAPLFLAVISILVAIATIT